MAVGKSPRAVIVPAGVTSRPLGNNVPLSYRPVGEYGVARFCDDVSARAANIGRHTRTTAHAPISARLVDIPTPQLETARAGDGREGRCRGLVPIVNGDRRAAEHSPPRAQDDAFAP
jgi:hypothetical protein